MPNKTEGSQVSYRPSDDVKKIFEMYCTGPASISRAQLIEVAMRFLASQGEEKMRETIVSYLLGENRAGQSRQKKIG